MEGGETLRGESGWSLQLTVFATSPIVGCIGLQPLFQLGLATDTIPDTRHRFATRLRNGSLALLTMGSAFAHRQSAFRQLDCRFHCCIYLILYRPIARPTSCHGLFLYVQHVTFSNCCSSGKPPGPCMQDSVYAFAPEMWLILSSTNARAQRKTLWISVKVHFSTWRTGARCGVTPSICPADGCIIHTH